MAKKKVKLKIAQNIKKLKEKNSLSQTDLCKKANLAYHTVAKIESGSTPDPRITTVQKIAAALGVTVDALLR